MASKKSTDPTQYDITNWPRPYPNNHIIVQNPDDPEMFYDTACKGIFISKKGLVGHLKKFHNVDIYGMTVDPSKDPNPGEPSPPGQQDPGSKPPAPIPGTDDDLKIEPGDSDQTISLKTRLKEARTIARQQNNGHNENVSFDNIEEYVIAESSKEIASYATKLVTDTTLMFLYHRTKRLFPPTFTFDQWISACVEYTLKQRFALNVAVNFDVAKLKPEDQDYVLQVNKLWDEYFKKQGVESAPGLIPNAQ